MTKTEAAAIASLQPANSTGDILSVLLSSPKLPMAKTWLADGTIKPYNQAKYFKLMQVPIKDIHELSKLLFRLEKSPNACLIRGKYVEDELAEERSGSDYKQGMVLRRNEIFEDQPLHAILIEVDEFSPTCFDPSDHLSAIWEFIALQLPSQFNNASYHWQLSSSAGHSTEQGKLKVHLWFWLDKPRTSAELKAWAKANSLNADHAVFNPVQVHYTAPPIFEQGLDDPIPMRSGFVPQERDGVELDIDHEIISVSPSSKQEKLSKIEALDNNLDRSFALAGVAGETIDDLHSALMGMDRKRADDRKLWIDVLEALASLKATQYADKALELAREFSQRCPEKYDADYLDKTWESLNPTQITYRSIFKWAQDDRWINPRSKLSQDYASRVDRTDAGNVVLLAQITNGNLRYIPEKNTWLHWSGEKWVADGYGVNAQDCALKVAEHYFAKARELREQTNDQSLDSSEIKQIEKSAESLEKWGTQCRNKRAIDAMLNLAKADERFTLPLDKLDRDQSLLGVANGVVDLPTGTLRPTSRDEYVTRQSPVRFDPQAKAPRWCQFIEEITAASDPQAEIGYKPRPALAAYLKKALGYCLTGSTTEHKLFIAIGSGANGKNVLLDTVQRIIGSYCQTIPPEALMANKLGVDAERPSSTIAMLAGARMAISSESKEGQRLDVALIKSHTGGGFMTARRMRENTFRFEITHKLWLMTNHKPSLDHIDEAVRGRLHLIPFDMKWNRPSHPDPNPKLPDGDKNLMEQLKDESEGILAWLIEGAVAYQKEGLEPPAEVANMTQSYFKENDPIARWVDECCEKCEPKQGTLARDLHGRFTTWFHDEWSGTASCPSQKAFSSSLQQRGTENQKLNSGMHYGLRILNK
jgi:putative DNA primase/helicase